MLQKFDGGKSQRVWDIVTGDETYIYQYDPETKQQSSVWLFQDQAPPSKFKRARSTSKQMMAVFFSKSGHVASVPLLERKTVTSEWYISTCLPQVFEAWSKRRPRTGTRGLLLHHDNASAHTAAATLDYLQEITSSLSPIPHIHLTWPHVISFYSLKSRSNSRGSRLPVLKMLESSPRAQFPTYLSQRGLEPLTVGLNE